MKRRRLELPRHNCHYPLKVARLPIPPSLRILRNYQVPRTGLEPARCETHAPETCASTNSATWAQNTYPHLTRYVKEWSGKRDSDPRPQPWQGCALPTELFPLVQLQEVKRRRLELPRHNCHYPLKVARLPIPPPLRHRKKSCPEQDSNLHASRHTHLKRARLPIPPPGQK